MISAEAQGRFAWVQIKLEQKKHMGPRVRVQVVPFSLTQAVWTGFIKHPTKSFVPQQRKAVQHKHICSVNYTSHKVYDLSSVLHVRGADNYLNNTDTLCLLDDCMRVVCAFCEHMYRKKISIPQDLLKAQKFVAFIHLHAKILLLTLCN